MTGRFADSILWRYRYFILTSIQSDFRARVARSRLGLVWIVIAPLSQVVIYAFVLSSLMTQRLPGIDTPFAYSIYLMAGFQGWFLFIEIINRCLTIFIESGNALKKISFPRMALPVIAVGAAILNNLIFFVLVVAAYLLVGYHPGWSLLWFPVLLLVTSALAAGLGLVLGVLNVFMRDVGQLVAILLQFGFWLTPVVYTIDILPPLFQDVVRLNPMFWMIDNYHRVLAYGEAPNLVSLAVIAAGAVALLGLALVLFRKASGEMVDVL
jgi:lipopolysaccharide transport system permease protein